MKYVIRTAALLVLLSGVCVGPAARANRLTNGMFDALVPTNGTGGGWDSLFLVGDGSAGHFPTGGNPAAFFALNGSGDLFTDPVLLQSISGLTVGTTYTITGDYKLLMSPTGAAAESFDVRLDNASLQTFGPPPGPQGQWGSFATSFVAALATHQISFAAETYGSGHAYGVDNLSVVVPEPGALLLALFAMGVAIAARGR